jgi:hypothetical protein
MFGLSATFRPHTRPRDQRVRLPPWAVITIGVIPLG